MTFVHFIMRLPDNLTSRTLTQGGSGAATSTFQFGERGFGPHQVTTSPWGAFTYDKNGDRTNDGPRTISFTPFHLPLSVVAGNQVTRFEYDAQHGRAYKESATATTTYVGGLYERRSDATGTHHVFHIVGPSGIVAELEVDQGSSVNTYRAHATGRIFLRRPSFSPQRCLSSMLSQQSMRFL